MDLVVGACVGLGLAVAAVHARRRARTAAAERLPPDLVAVTAPEVAGRCFADAQGRFRVTLTADRMSVETRDHRRFPIRLISGRDTAHAVRGISRFPPTTQALCAPVLARFLRVDLTETRLTFFGKTSTEAVAEGWLVAQRLAALSQDRLLPQWLSSSESDLRLHALAYLAEAGVANDAHWDLVDTCLEADDGKVRKAAACLLIAHDRPFAGRLLRGHGSRSALPPAPCEALARSLRNLKDPDLFHGLLDALCTPPPAPLVHLVTEVCSAGRLHKQAEDVLLLLMPLLPYLPDYGPHTLLRLMRHKSEAVAHAAIDHAARLPPERADILEAFLSRTRDDARAERARAVLAAQKARRRTGAHLAGGVSLNDAPDHHGAVSLAREARDGGLSMEVSGVDQGQEEAEKPKKNKAARDQNGPQPQTANGGAASTTQQQT